MPSLEARLARLEAPAPEHPLCADLRAWFDRTRAEDPDAAEAYRRAVNRAMDERGRRGEPTIGTYMFPRLERDREWVDFVRFGMAISAARGETPRWLVAMLEDGVPGAADWLAWLRAEHAAYAELRRATPCRPDSPTP